MRLIVLDPDGSLVAEANSQAQSSCAGTRTKRRRRVESSEDEPGSASESGSSSSSSSVSPSGNAATVANVAGEVVYCPQRASQFKDKLRGSLQRATTREARTKLRLIYTNRQQYVRVSTMKVVDLMAFCEELYHAFGKPVPRPPPDEPPRHVLERVGILAPAPAVVPWTTTTSHHSSASSSTDAGLMPHRNPSRREPTRGCLRRRILGRFHPHARRISFFNSGSGDQYNSEVSRETIDSMRTFSRHLWFQQLGEQVTCEACGQEVPASYGGLVGMPGASQFAQDTFYCQPCLDIT